VLLNPDAIAGESPFTDDVKERHFWEDDEEGMTPGGGAAAAA